MVSKRLPQFFCGSLFYIFVAGLSGVNIELRKVEVFGKRKTFANVPKEPRGGNSISGFLLRIIINSIIMLVIVSNLPDMVIDTLGGALLGVFFVGLANAAIRTLLLPVLPVDFWGLTGFTLLVNILVSFLVVKILPGFEINNFLSFTLVMSFVFLTLCSVTLTKLIKDR